MAAPEKLAAYRRKRDFEVTAEPSGEARIAPAPHLRFIVQKHAASRLHYDFRLEFGGVLKSWAVTRGPSLDPHDRRLAVEVEDHPLDYGDFEGVIPEGQYGGGSVMLWDRGYWAPEPGVAVGRALQKGELKFVLEGRRLHGGFVLVRLDRDRNGGKRKNWLLIKHRDEWAREGESAEAFLDKHDRSIASGRTMSAIAKGSGAPAKPFITDPARPLAADRVWRSRPARGATESAAPQRGRKKAAAGDPPAGFIAPQLCRIVDRPPAAAGWVHEIKFDGYRMQLRVASDGMRFFSRRGLDWTKRFPEIVADGARLAGGVYDGEVVALDSQGAPDFAGLQAALSERRTAALVYFVFDQLFAAGEDLRSLPLSARKARLAASLKGAGRRLRFVDHFASGGEAVLRSACRLHLEGVVSKRIDAPYRSGRGDDWTKAKCRGGQEVVIAGWRAGEGGALRSLIAGVMRDGRLVHAGRIGSGFSQASRTAVLRRLQTLERETPPFADAPASRKRAGEHWVEPTLVAEIESGGWTGSGLLRQASFKGLREDKTAGEVVRETPTPVAAIEGKSAASGRPADKGDGSVMGVRLSHPDKRLWPARGSQPALSKRDLALYFEAMAPLIMPHIAGRPCSLIRAPDGIGGQMFFQRHAGPGTSSLIDVELVSGDRKPYLEINRPEGLAAVAQSGGVELHPWNCAPRQPDVPGRLVFDLDPAPGIDFAWVIEGAREIRDRLQDVGLAAFAKTTGGKGLHVVVPLTPSRSVNWPAAKAFAKTLCARLAADSPERYLLTLSKAERVGRIFLDYLRNDRMATAVAPFSPRARPGAPVSWPLTWRQVRAGLDPMDFTLATAPRLARKANAWEGYEAAARPLKPAIERLSEAR